MTCVFYHLDFSAVEQVHGNNYFTFMTNFHIKETFLLFIIQKCPQVIYHHHVVTV